MKSVLHSAQPMELLLMAIWHLAQAANRSEIPQDAKLVFTSKIINGVAHYTGVDIVASDGATTSIPITPAATLAEINGLNETSGLRFIPEGDNDADVTISMSGRVVDVRSGGCDYS